MAKKLELQPYPRAGNTLLADYSLFPLPSKQLDDDVIKSSIKLAFERCVMTKVGKKKGRD